MRSLDHATRTPGDDAVGCPGTKGSKRHHRRSRSPVAPVTDGEAARLAAGAARLASLQAESEPGTDRAAAVTVITNGARAPCCKVFTLTPGGKLSVRHAAQVHEGTAERRSVADLADLAGLVADLKANQALVYGVTDAETAPIVTLEALERGRSQAGGIEPPEWQRVPPGAVARSREHFRYAAGQPGILMLDYDPRVKGQGLDFRDVDAAIAAAFPPLGEVARMWKPSSSAFIYGPDGTELYGPGGWRGYVMIDDASAIPVVGAAIYQALWAAGHGYIQVSKSGALLDRTLVDAAVWQPERLDFAAEPILKGGLTRRAPGPEALPGKPMLEASSVAPSLDMAEWRRTSPELAAARKGAGADAAKARAAFVREEGTALARRRKIDAKQAKAIARRAVERRELAGEFELTLPNGTTVTVAAILDDPARWHEARCADPLEPDYADDRRIAYIASNPADGEPYIWSHAHGGIRYALIPTAPQPLEGVPHGGTGLAFERQRQFMVVRKPVIVDGQDFGPGVWWVEADEEGGERWFWLCTRLEPLAATRGRDQLNWGRYLELYDMDGHRQVWPMPMSRLERDAAEFRAALADRGLNRTPGGKGAAMLETFLRTWRPTRRMRSVERVGWCGDAFVMPDRQHGGLEECTLQLEGTAPEFECRGTLEGWRENVAALCAGNSRLTFAASMAFAGPLIRLTGEESGGFHLYGPSSMGKTTLAHVTRSAWGAALGSWRGTDNAAEATAVGANDTALVLDEIGQADGRVVAALAYMLGNGKGKSRMMANATLRRHHKWSILFLSTGETPMAAKLLEDGQTARAGQQVRVLEIDADAGCGMGVFDSLPPRFASAAEMAAHFRDAADYERGRNPQCGHAARAYLDKLTADLPRWSSEVGQLRDAFVASHCPDGADGQVRRACGRFALVSAAGTLATRFGITGWAAEDAEDAAARLFGEWMEQRGGAGNAETREGFAQVRLFLEQHGESRFSLAWDPKADRPVINRAGFRKAGDGEGWTYYVLPEVWRRDVCKGLDAAKVAKAMAERGWMLKENGRQLTRKERIPGEGNQRVHVILAAFLTADA